MSKKIKLVRIDKRLLHATVALNWNSYVNADYILIIDPENTNDIFVEKVLQLSFPGKGKVYIFSVQQLIEFLDVEVETSVNIIIIFKNLKSLEESLDLGLIISEVQLPYPASRILMKNIKDYFSDKDVKRIRKMQKNGVRFYFQTTPMDLKNYSFFHK